MAQQAIIDAASRLLDEPVIDAVLIMHRPKWALILFAVVGVPIALDLNIVVTMIVAAMAGGAFSYVCEARFIVLTPTRLALATATKFPVARPKDLERQLSKSSVVFLSKPGINSVVAVDQREYIVSRLFSSRLRAMVDQAV